MKLRLLHEVRGDFPGHEIVAHQGEYGGREIAVNRHGAVSVETKGGWLGIKPDEMEWIEPPAIESTDLDTALANMRLGDELLQRTINTSIDRAFALGGAAMADLLERVLVAWRADRSGAEEFLIFPTDFDGHALVVEARAAIERARVS